MRASIFVVCGFLGAAFTASGCTTNPVDALSTTSITPPAREKIREQLAQGKSQYHDGDNALAE
jgi:hypothetical protein